MTDKKAPKTKIDTNQDINVANLQDQVEQLTAALQLERADAVNIRRRAEEEKLKLGTYFKSNVIKDLIPFIDNFDLSLKHFPNDIKKQQEWIKGIESLNRQLWQILDTIGLKKINSLGKEFDPALHEAVSVDDSQSGLKEVIQEEFRAGYELNGQVIRPAMVKVARK